MQLTRSRRASQVASETSGVTLITARAVVGLKAIPERVHDGPRYRGADWGPKAAVDKG
jgi:hypothetical protein